jgi:hypothetical protein
MRGRPSGRLPERAEVGAAFRLSDLAPVSVAKDA